jgi:MerR family transcriptional regulator, Zn(II)-responsive regulator of zntA
MRSGELARRAGVSADTIRHYERLGLLKTAPRAQNGYREFPPDSLDRARLIRRAVAMGFSLVQLAHILRVRDAGGSPCHTVFAGAKAGLARINQEIRELKAARRQLQGVLNDWARRLSTKRRGRPARLLESLAEGDKKHANPGYRVAGPALQRRNKLRPNARRARTVR